jgi:hypothetical protein
MAARETEAGINGTIREILNLADGGAKPSPPVAEDYFRAFCRVDYARALRKQFDRRQFSQLLAEFRSVLPALNREIFAITDLRRLAGIAAELGAGLQARHLETSDGRALRGFYVKGGEVLRKPLICVNTANHPVAVAASFWHEVGHHLTRRIFDDHRERATLSFSTNYLNHLEDPHEIAADMVMVLAGYPNPAAKRLFGASERKALNLNANLLISKVRPHVRATGFEFDARVSAVENLHYLASIIHIAKLRSTLLREYGI